MLYYYNNSDCLATAVIESDTKPDVYLLEALAKKADSECAKLYRDKQEQIREWVKANKANLRIVKTAMQSACNSLSISEKSTNRIIDRALELMAKEHIPDDIPRDMVFIEVLEGAGFKTHKFADISYEVPELLS